MRIAIINQPTGDRGDEAAHWALMRSLTKAFPLISFDVIYLDEPQVKVDGIKLIHPNINYINIENPSGNDPLFCMKLVLATEIPAFTYFHPTLREYVKLISHYDLIICAPGGIDMGGYMIWPHIFTLYIAMRQKKKILYWGRSIGPFTDEDKGHHLFKKISYKLLEYFDYISLRDDVSFKLAYDLGINCIQTVDSVFLNNPASEIPASYYSELNGKPYIVFVPNELKWHYNFAKYSKNDIDRLYLKIMEIANQAFPNHMIVMLPQMYNTRANDYPYLTTLKEASGLHNIIVVDDQQNSDIQQSIIAHSDYVIGARYHSIVYSINQGIPFLSLSYEYKMSGMLSYLGESKRHIPIDSILSKISSNTEFNKMMEQIKTIMSDFSSVTNAQKKAQETSSTAFEKMISHIS